MIQDLSFCLGTILQQPHIIQDQEINDLFIRELERERKLLTERLKRCSQQSILKDSAVLLDKEVMEST